ncbi:MAG: hypothetical protein WDW36_005948 [Sanguina aurantia]
MTVRMAICKVFPDVGFGGLQSGAVAFDNNVINTYFHSHFPRAVRLATEMRATVDRSSGTITDTFVYTTHAWLLSLFFDCPPGIGLECPDDAAVAELDAAIRHGDVTWHAGPFNSQAEMYDPELYEFGLSMAHDLDARFGLPKKTMMSQRDVPGLTRAAVPLLSKMGVRVLTVGVNYATSPPAVPHNTPFIWRDPDSGSQVVAMWHPGGYCGMSHGVNVDSRSDCVSWEGFSHVLCVSWRNDNWGPPESLYEVGEVYMHLRDEFPGAKIVASGGFESYGEALVSALPQLDLPVFIGEVGDTWMYGTASDPHKVADFRAVMRARRQCLREGLHAMLVTHSGALASGARDEAAQPYTRTRLTIRGPRPTGAQDPAFRNFSRLLLTVGEHTWGLAVQVLEDFSSWSNEQLQAALPTPNFQAVVRSWERQASYIPWALGALPPDHFIVSEFEKDRALRAVDGPPNPKLLQGVTSSYSVGRQSPAKKFSFKTEFWEGWIDSKTGLFGSLQFRWPADSRRRPHAATASEQAGTAGGSNRKTGAEQPTPTASGGRKTGAVKSLQQPAGRGAAAAAAGGRHREDDDDDAGGDGDHTPELGNDWAGTGSELGSLVYSTFTEEDFKEMLTRHYSNTQPPWYTDFGKPNCSSADPRKADLSARFQGMHQAEHEAGLTLMLEFKFDAWAVRLAGAPQSMWVTYAFSKHSEAIQMEVAWINKTATRLPEALWVKFKPGGHAVDSDSWVMHKLGSQISPMEVVRNGSYSQHGVQDEGVSVRAAPSEGGDDAWEVLHIRSLDAHLVSPGQATPLPNVDQVPDLSLGMSFCLTNNVFGTNFVLWMPYREEDSSLKFRQNEPDSKVVPPVAPKVLMLHGIGSGSYCYRNTMSMLASAGFNAVAPDWIGHGSSDKPAPGPAFDYSSAAYIKELENFVSAQGMTEPFALIVHGFIMGQFGLLYAQQHPEQVSRLLVLNTPVSKDTKLRPELAPYKAPFSFMRPGNKPFNGINFNASGSPYAMDYNDALIYDRCYREEPAASVAITAIMERVDFPKLVAEVDEGFRAWRQPTVVLFGSSDTFITTASAFEFLEDKRTNMKVMNATAKLGHMPQEDYPSAIQDIIEDFLVGKTDAFDLTTAKTVMRMSKKGLVVE